MPAPGSSRMQWTVGTWQKVVAECDELISSAAIRWQFSRLSPVDRSILRLSVYQLKFCSDIPPKVVINEAIELAKRFSTEKSGPFVNGVLDAVLKKLTSEKAGQHTDRSLRRCGRDCRCARNDIQCTVMSLRGPKRRSNLRRTISRMRGNEVNGLRTIAVLNQKGGVGKTTTTVNVAAAWPPPDRRSSSIDLDPQAHLTIHLGVEPESVTAGGYEVLTQSATVREQPEAGPAESLDARSQHQPRRCRDRAGQRRRPRDHSARSHAGQQDIVRLLLHRLRPSLGLLSLNALAASQEV